LSRIECDHVRGDVQEANRKLGDKEKVQTIIARQLHSNLALSNRDGSINLNLDALPVSAADSER
jgi:hypothetical protein